MPNSDDSFHDWFRNTIGAELPKIALSPARLVWVQGALKWYSGGAYTRQSCAYLHKALHQQDTTTDEVPGKLVM